VGGVAAAVLVSAATAGALQAVDATLSGRAEQIFEAVTMLIAASVLTWMILGCSARDAGRRMPSRPKCKLPPNDGNRGRSS